MSSQFKIGIAGLTHGHVWGLIEKFKQHPEIQLICAAESDEVLQKLEDPNLHKYSDWQEMLKSETLDGLIVTSDNKTSSQIAIQALSQGIPCIVEKAMARNSADADDMLAAASKSGKTLMINWPIAWTPWLTGIHDELQSGKLGKIFHFKMRQGHSGPKEIGCGPEFYGWLYQEELNGGGAIADFCGYGAVVSRWLLGMPESVYALRGNYTKDYEVPDDHAVCLLKYPFGSAVLEGTWATKGWDPSGNPVIHGSNGTLSVFEGKLKLNMGSEAFELPSPEVSPSNPAEYFVECLKGIRKPEGILDPKIAADACRIIDAAKASAISGCAVKP